MLSKEEIEKDNAFKISMPLITDEDIRKIDNNFENIVKEFTKSYVKEKDLVLAQHIMKKQQDKLDQLEADKQKLIEKLEERIKAVDKCYNKLLTDVGGIKIINVTGLTKKEKEKIINKRNCLLVQKYCYEEILEILKN